MRQLWTGISLLTCVLGGCDGMASSSSDAGAGVDGATADGATHRNDSDVVGPDARGSDAGGTNTDAGSAEPPAGIPMFVAQGMLGRSTLSCDDGRTWVADRSFHTEGGPLVCGSTDPVICDATPCSYLRGGECLTDTPCDCGHHPGFGKGVTYGDGWFVATWGWGHSGSVRRSRDGVTWEETLGEATDGVWVSFGGVAYGNGRFVLSSREPYFSIDGADWVAGAEADFRGPGGEIVWSVRDLVFIGDSAAGRFVASADPPEDVLITDDGATWRRPAERPSPCVQDVSGAGGMAQGNGVTVSLGGDGRLCTSTDYGDHWTEHPGGIGANTVWSRNVLWTGSEFVVWGAGADSDTRMYRSSDGITWTGIVTDPPRIRTGSVAQSAATGTFVSAGHIWDAYDGQQFYRSEDGITWEALPDGAFNPSHNIFEIAFGYGAPSDVCPTGGA